MDRDGQVYQAGLYAVWFTLIGIGIAVLTVFQQYCLTVAGEQLTVRLRERVFNAMLYQEMSYFDEPANGVGNLTARLATDAAAVKGVSCHGNVYDTRVYTGEDTRLFNIFLNVIYNVTYRHQEHS